MGQVAEAVENGERVSPVMSRKTWIGMAVECMPQSACPITRTIRASCNRS